MAETKSLEEYIPGYGTLYDSTINYLTTNSVIPCRNGSFAWDYPASHPYDWRFYKTVFIPMTTYF